MSMNNNFTEAATMQSENPTLSGRYHVIRQLGQGGMGSVYLAEDTKLDNRRVAIKLLPSILISSRRSYAQVKAEAIVSLKLSHPNIAAFRGFEENNGSPYLVIDYIDGQSLDDYLAVKGKLSEEETIKLLSPIAAAIDYAHTEGVVHRDIKPGNVMIRNDGHPFILDFGIAREIQETMTRMTGKLSSGTLMYMSPEQLNGDAAKPAQDVYSFAAMCYECLTGSPPFKSGQIEYQIINKAPPALPDTISIAHGIMAGLAKDLSSRPSTCAEVLGNAFSYKKSSPVRFVTGTVEKDLFDNFSIWMDGGLSSRNRHVAIGTGRNYSSAISRTTRGKITIPSLIDGDEVTGINAYAFYCCNGLTSVTIPEGVTRIGDWAFYGCSGLTSVTIPLSVTSIGRFAFWGCSGLTSVTIPEGVTRIGDCAFYGCSGLTSVTIPSSGTSIGESAFWGCSGLTSVTIPEGVTSIGCRAFYGCSGLTSVTIPSTVPSIGKEAFGYCISLENINFEGNAPECGRAAFSSVKVGCTATVYDGTYGWRGWWKWRNTWHGLKLVWRKR